MTKSKPKKDEYQSEASKRRAEQEAGNGAPYADANTKSQVNPYNPEGHAETEEGETGKAKK